MFRERSCSSPRYAHVQTYDTLSIYSIQPDGAKQMTKGVDFVQCGRFYVENLSRRSGLDSNLSRKKKSYVSRKCFLSEHLRAPSARSLSAQARARPARPEYARDNVSHLSD